VNDYQAAAAELLRGISTSSAQGREHLAVAMEVLAQHLRHDEDELAVVYRLDDLLLDEPAEDLGTLLLARATWALFLTRESDEHLFAAGLAPEPGETCMQTTARQKCLEASPGGAGQQTMLCQEPLVVGVEEQVEVLAHRAMKICRLRLTLAIDAWCRAAGHATNQVQVGGRKSWLCRR